MTRAHIFEGRCNRADRTTAKDFAKDPRVPLVNEAMAAFDNFASKGRKRRKRPTMASFRHLCCTGTLCVWKAYLGNNREVTANVVIACDGATYGAELNWRRQPWPTRVWRPV
jgi:hypothetical protein